MCVCVCVIKRKNESLFSHPNSKPHLINNYNNILN